ncbi:MAG: luciferase family protein, partial [uncultured Solirubrobacteraceae bacterium]
ARALRARPRSGLRGRHRGRGARRQRPSGASRRRPRLPPLLGGRASQHPIRRLDGAGSAAFAPRGADRADPAGLRRGHAAQPRSPGRRRALRHAGGAVSGSHRPGPGPRARQRPEHDVLAAPHPGLRRPLPAGRARAAGVPRRRD